MLTQLQSGALASSPVPVKQRQCRDLTASDAGLGLYLMLLMGGLKSGCVNPWFWTIPGMLEDSDGYHSCLTEMISGSMELRT